MADSGCKVFNMEELQGAIKKIVPSFVRKSFEDAHNDPIQKQQWEEKYVSGYKALIRLGLSSGMIDETMAQRFEDELNDHWMPNEEFIDEMSEEVSYCLSSAWLQFIWLLLTRKKKPELILGEDLIPRQNDAPKKYWEAFGGSINSLAISISDRSDILKKFATDFLQNCEKVDLPWNISINLTRSGYVAYLREVS